MRMEMLHEFIVLAVQLNYTSAAKHLHISQPNLSRHILELEQELGFDLLTRGTNIHLTPAGAAFLDDAVQINLAYKASLERCRNIHSNSAEEIVIQEPYVIDSLGEIVYQTVRAFRNKHPLEPIRLHADRGKKSVESLRARHIDIGISYDCGDVARLLRHGEQQGLIYIPIVREPLVVWLHKNHHLASRKSLLLDDLKDVPISVTAARHLDPLRFSVVSLLENAGYQPKLRTYASATLEEFYLNTQNEDALFLTTKNVTKSSVLHMQKWMITLPFDDHRAQKISYLVLRDDYTKKGIDLFLDVLEKTIVNDIDQDKESDYLKDIVN